ncbi:MAG: serine/threonine protein phosphatase [Spirochaetales bacterium]|nr:serine/threonine protein phosphatase [Spirochaetales bacterium]
MSISSDDIYAASEICLYHKARTTNSYGKPGGLIDLRNDSRKLVIVGDLHGSIENLKAIAEHPDIEDGLKNNQYLLVIIGDGIHNDQTGEMLEMASSLEVLEYVFELFFKYKENFFYIRGNHDTFEERLAKSGIKQGLEFKNYLLANRGEEYYEATDYFFDMLPMYIIGKNYAITHAGPIRNGATLQEIIDIDDNEDYYRQLMWNRLHEFRGTPSLKEYDESDIRKMNRKMGLPEDAYFIVGHNPMWHTGNKTGVWVDIIGIKNHIIVYTNKATLAPYLILDKSGVTVNFARSNKTEIFYGRS